MKYSLNYNNKIMNNIFSIIWINRMKCYNNFFFLKIFNNKKINTEIGSNSKK